MNLDDIRARLSRDRDELMARVQRTHKHIHERDEPVSSKFSEQSVEMDNQELVLNLDAEGRYELELIDKALARLDTGSYGSCTRCGKDINEERLAAVPAAEACIACANDMEQS